MSKTRLYLNACLLQFLVSKPIQRIGQSVFAILAELVKSQNAFGKGADGMFAAVL
ncbi:hypothetical protein AB4037_28690 [Labrys sp. KB_33_2]|uniref:hypothetical protein n=1 Tax=Labrys sp. KB_33_2 TaxID=3237479 RepID=UPI003F8DF286